MYCKSIYYSLMLLVLPSVLAYAMQPPPPPLTIPQLKLLVKKADLIVVGTVENIVEAPANVEELGTTVEVTINIEEIMKKGNCGQRIHIRETLPGPFREKAISLPDSGSNSGSGQTISAFKAGPRFYHGTYSQGDRLLLFLRKIDYTCEFIPLGSGTYTEHLGEFLIKDDEIRTFYYEIGDDLRQYSGSNKIFLQFIKSIIDQKSKE